MLFRSLVERALQEARSPDLRAQDTSRYLVQFFNNPAARVRAWAFLKEHWGELEPKIDVAYGDVRLVGSLGAFCDASTAADIRSFFTSHPLRSAGRALEETVERIEKCVELNRTESSRVSQWLDATVQ